MLRRLFGDDVAENDAHLSEYFIETPAYRMALSGEKRFIIGRKGAGKSAICQQLQKQLPKAGALCIPLAPQRIQFTALKLGLSDLSRWKIDDLCNEFLFALPGLKENVLQRFLGGSARFTPPRLRTLLEDALTDPRSIARQEWLEKLRHADELIQVLYNIGFLKSTSQGKHWQSAQDPDYNIALAEAFVVHPVFRSYLRIG